jgi:ribosome-associated protein
MDEVQSPTRRQKTPRQQTSAVLAMARLAVDVASEKQASDILMLDVRKLTPFTDYIIILTADNLRQINALAEDIRIGLKTEGVDLHHREGTPESGWVLMDFADVVVHIFAPNQRDFYSLEQVWEDARQVVRIQ